MWNVCLSSSFDIQLQRGFESLSNFTTRDSVQRTLICNEPVTEEATAMLNLVPVPKETMVRIGSLLRDEFPTLNTSQIEAGFSFCDEIT